ncbi:MAG: hypothetical protein OXH52_16290 [Gammaproteobacteria bacterium]|nr:hypothetical protein [Gammaproteobacteria bacterium]
MADNDQDVVIKGGACEKFALVVAKVIRNAGPTSRVGMDVTRQGHELDRRRRVAAVFGANGIGVQQSNH